MVGAWLPTLIVVTQTSEYISNGTGITPYGAYAADVNLDSSALKDAAVDCSTTWDGSEFQSPTVRTAKHIEHIEQHLALKKKSNKNRGKI